AHSRIAPTCRTSSCSSVVSSSRRVCAIATTVPANWLADCSRLDAGRSLCCALARMVSSAPTQQQAEQQAHAGGNAHRLPGILAYVHCSRVRSFTCATQRLVLARAQARAGLLQRFLRPRANLLDLLSGLGRSRLEQRFGITHDR